LAILFIVGGGDFCAQKSPPPDIILLFDGLLARQGQQTIE